MELYRTMIKFDHLPTIFHLTHLKAGSQWVYSILASAAPDRIVIPDDELSQFTRQPILPGMIYPTLYLTYEEFSTVTTPQPQSKFVVIRDLRDTLISLYYSARYSHSLGYLFSREQRRDFLNGVSKETGLHRLMVTQLSRVARIQTSWVNSGEPLFRYESLLADEVGQFSNLFRICGLELAPEQIRNIVDFCSFERQSGRDRGVEDIMSHRRKGIVGDWSNHLSGPLLAEFKEYFDEVLIETGYEANRDWGLDALPRSYTGVFVRQSETDLHCWCEADELVSFSAHYLKCLGCGTLVCKYSDIPYPARGVTQELDRVFPFIYRPKTIHQLADDPILSLLQTILDYQQPPGQILDLGCGSDKLTALLDLAGFDIVKCKCESQLAETAAARPVASFIFSSSATHSLPPDLFKVILLINTLSQLSNPVETLKRCRHLLASDGLLFILCFLFDTPASYNELCASGSPLLSYLQIPQHRYLFSNAALKTLFEKAGYGQISFDNRYLVMVAAQTLSINSDAARALDSADAAGRQLIMTLLAKQHQLELTTQYQSVIQQKFFRQITQALCPDAAILLHSDLITIGQGWHVLEEFQGDTFCWVSNLAELIVLRPTGHFRNLRMELEPGPGLNGWPLQLQFLDEMGQTVAESEQVVGRQWVEVLLPVVAGERVVFRLQVEGGGHSTPNDPRILNFRVFQFGWTNKGNLDADLPG